MADKKKKIFSAKDNATPRRPVILKSDREAPKEHNKEKQEKEKQPTFILKTREQSAPKDESGSKEKTQGADMEGNKLAHENKEKKIIESKPTPPLKQMTEAVKLLDENLEFNPAAVEFLHDSSISYLVVGILGTQGVGKSTVMNLIGQNKIDGEITAKILNSYEMGDQDDEVQTITALENQMEKIDLSGDNKDKVPSKNESDFKFKIQSLKQIERGVHCTKDVHLPCHLMKSDDDYEDVTRLAMRYLINWDLKTKHEYYYGLEKQMQAGIDMFVTKDRVILLDCQALFAPGLIEESNTNPITSRSATVVTVDCLQIASYLMSICHVLIAVQDWFADYNFIRYIQTAEMLKPSFSASNPVPSSQENSENNPGECHPHLLLLHNRTQLEDFTTDAVRTMQDFYKKAFQRSNLQINSGMYLYSDSNRNGLNVDKVCKNYSVESCGSPINLFLLPEIYEDYDNQDIYRGHPSFEHLAKRLRWMIMGVNRHQISNVPNISEKAWFHYCNKAWDTIKKCTFFMEYERFLP